MKILERFSDEYGNTVTLYEIRKQEKKLYLVSQSMGGVSFTTYEQAKNCYDDCIQEIDDIKERQ